MTDPNNEVHPRRTLKSDVKHVLDSSGNFLNKHKWKIGGGALGAYFLLQTISNLVGAAQNAAEKDEASDAKADYIAAIQAAAIEPADVENIIGTPMEDQGNGLSPRIYAQAMAQLEQLGLDDEDGINAKSVDISSKAVSAAGFIHADRFFVLAEGEFDGNPATKEVIVQLAPEGYVTEDTELTTE